MSEFFLHTAFLVLMPAALASRQSAGSGTRPVLIETKRFNTGTEKYSS